MSSTSPVAEAVMTRTAPRADSHWLPGIEVLRAVAALAVVFHHLYDLAGGGDFTGATIIEGFGEWGVDLFFLLSAFLLAEYFWHPRRQRPLRVFWLRRVLRIAPAYYACLVVLFLFFADRTLLYSRQGFEQVLSNGAFVQWLRPGTSSSLNVDGALWTLTIEAMLYLALPAMALLMARRAWLWALAFVAAGSAWRIVVALHGDGISSFYFGTDGPPAAIERLFIARQFIGFLPVFAVGILVRHLAVSGRLPRWAGGPLRRPSLLVMAALAVPSVLLLRGIVPDSDYNHWARFAFFDLVLAVLAAPLLVYAGRPATSTPTPPVRALVWLGKRSYGLYLWHFPVILSIYERGPQMAPAVLTHLWVRVVAVLVVSIGLAAASYRLIELPAMELARRLSREWLARSAERGGGKRPAAAVAPATGTAGRLLVAAGEEVRP